jgi:hypothetical protein
MQMWGGVIVWNPKGCLKDSESQHPIRHTISRQVRCLSAKLFKYMYFFFFFFFFHFLISVLIQNLNKQVSFFNCINLYSK